MTEVDKGRILAICEAGPRVGYGHLMRTIATAARLRELGWDVGMVVKGPARAISAAKQVSAIEGGPRVTPVSRFGRMRSGRFLLDTRDNSAVLSLVPGDARVAAFDDQGRNLAVDVIINGNAFASPEMYRGSRAMALFGPRYLPLRKGFLNRRAHPLLRRRFPRAIVALGGGAHSQSMRLVNALKTESFVVSLLPGFHGRGAELPSDALRPWKRMANASIAVIGGGSIAYEAACLGLPAVSCPTVPGQMRNARSLEEHGTLVVAGYAARESPLNMARLCAEISEDTALSQRMSRAGRELVDGRGAARLADVLDKEFG